MTERDDLLDTLHKHRGLFLVTVQDLTDEQARLTPTVSVLSLGGLVKHVSAVERSWAEFVTDGPRPQPDVDWASVDWSDPPELVKRFQEGFRLLEDETLAGLVAESAEEAAGAERRGG